MKNIIFLDIDGVLNCQLHYHSLQFESYRDAKKQLVKDVKAERIDRMEYYKSQISLERILWFNELVKETDSGVVISSTWRLGKTVEELQGIFDACGGTFKVLDVTPHTGYARGTEIYKWLYDNTEKYFGIKYFDFYRYAIIDDDSDMLLTQQYNFFQTDNYSGLTPTTCYKIKRFFTNKTF